MSRDRFQRPDWYEDEDDLDRPAPPRPAPGKATLTSRIGRPNIQRKAASPRKVSLTTGLPRPAGLAIGRAAQSPGWPLPDDLRGRLEGSLGQDLGAVRVHTGAESAAAAEAVQAKAYTTGPDIHFAAGRYDPGSRDGERLIAHEVAHTVQQQGAAGAAQAKPEVSSPGDFAEIEADQFADAFAAGQKGGQLSAAVLRTEVLARKQEPAASPPQPEGASADAEGAEGDAAADVLSAIGRSDPVAGPVDYGGALRALQAIGSLANVIATLEAVEQAGEFDRFFEYAKQYAPNDGRIMTAFQLVAGVGRGDRSENAVENLNQSMAGLPAADCFVAVKYVTRTVGAGDMEAEGLLAALRPSSALGVPSQLLAAAPGVVLADPYSPPGDQSHFLYLGNEAHDRIADRYRTLHGGEAVFVNTTPISTILKHPSLALQAHPENVSESDLQKKPDIANLTTRELYEIKPWTSPGAAQSQLLNYILIFKAADIDMKPGSSSAAGTIGVIPAPGGHYRYESPLPGVILYEWRRGDYAPTPEFKREEVSLWDKLKRATGLDGWELAILAIVVGGAVILVAPEAAPALAPAL